jgi:DNA polymerase III subunit gamma/tau
MAGYLVLARKYRSTTFDELVGQEPIAQTLKNAIKTGRVAHAYLFTGTRGVGKTTVARILAKALNCLSFDGPTETPCNKCDACIAIGRGDDVDVVEIDGASNRGIDEIRQLRANAIFRPSRSRYKIYYIDEVHMLTKEAFNALLKTLEEPPEHVKFIFATTETEKVPATILSRCQRYDFRNIPTKKIADHLKAICTAEGVQADDDALFRVARAGAGSMRDSLSLLDQLIAAGGGKVTDADVVTLLGTPSEERTLTIAAAIVDGNAAAALTEFAAVLEGGVSLQTAVVSLAEVFRNMMLCQVCGDTSDLVELPDQQRQAVAGLAKRLSVPSTVQAVGILQSLVYKVRGSSVARALAEASIVRLAAADKFVDPESLAQRIEALSRGQTAPATRPAMAPRAGAYNPAPTDVKKNGLVNSDSPVAPPSTSAAQPTAPPPDIRWELAWLQANWLQVVDTLMTRRQMAVAGLVKPAAVAAFDGSTLTLNYPQNQDILRQRASQGLTAIEQSLSALAGRAIHCLIVAAAPADGNAPASSGPARSFGGLSTAQKAQIMKDPAVQAVLDLFGGDVVDITRKEVPPEP